MGADGSVDKDMEQTQEAAGGSSDAQEFLFLEDIIPKVQYSDSDDSDDSDDEGRLKCPKCPKSFLHKRQLNDHRRNDCGKDLRCPSCTKVFTQSKNLKAHLDKGCNALTGFPFKCGKCGKNFVYEGHLNRHKKTCCFKAKINDDQSSTGKAKQVISAVNAGGASPTKKDSTTPHIKTCAKKCKCPSCKKIFSDSGTLSIHLSKGCNAVFKCGKCKRTFVDNHILNQHKESVCFKVKIKDDQNSAARVKQVLSAVNGGGDLPTKKGSITPDKAKRVKRYKCPSCKLIFKQKAYFKMHRKRGCSKVVFTCQTCFKVYSTQCRLSRHGERGCLARLKCQWCKRIYKLKKTLRVHLKKGCSAIHECGKCCQIITSEASFTRHKRVCGKTHIEKMRAKLLRMKTSRFMP